MFHPHFLYYFSSVFPPTSCPLSLLFWAAPLSLRGAAHRGMANDHLLEHLWPLRVATLKKRHLPSFSNQQLQIAPQMGWGIIKASPPMVGYWPRAKHCHVQSILLHEADIWLSQGRLPQNSSLSFLIPSQVFLHLTFLQLSQEGKPMICMDLNIFIVDIILIKYFLIYRN